MHMLLSSREVSRKESGLCSKKQNEYMEKSLDFKVSMREKMHLSVYLSDYIIYSLLSFVHLLALLTALVRNSH